MLFHYKGDQRSFSIEFCPSYFIKLRNLIPAEASTSELQFLFNRILRESLEHMCVHIDTNNIVYKLFKKRYQISMKNYIYLLNRKPQLR